MSTQFENAPIVELVAEVRWHTSGSQEITDAKLGSTFSIDSVNPSLENFLARFSAGAAKAGYVLSERIVPIGVPTMPGQPIYRYRSPDIGGILVQAGWGVATINAVPPYKSWTDFSPRLKEVLEVLVAAREDDRSPFYAASVRYINAFGADYLEGTTASEFARDVLGFGASLPQAIDDERKREEAPQFSLQVAFPTTSGLRARMVVAEGIARDEQALIFDITLGTAEPVDAIVESTFTVLDNAHDVVHRMFEGLTSKVRPLMRPIGES